MLKNECWKYVWLRNQSLPGLRFGKQPLWPKSALPTKLFPSPPRVHRWISVTLPRGAQGKAMP